MATPTPTDINLHISLNISKVWIETHHDSNKINFQIKQIQKEAHRKKLQMKWVQKRENWGLDEIIVVFLTLKMLGVQFEPLSLAVFPKLFFSTESVKSYFSVNFNITIKHIFPENFIDMQYWHTAMPPCLFLFKVSRPLFVVRLSHQKLQRSTENSRKGRLKRIKQKPRDFQTIIIIMVVIFKGFFWLFKWFFSKVYCVSWDGCSSKVVWT